MKRNLPRTAIIGCCEAELATGRHTAINRLLCSSSKAKLLLLTLVKQQRYCSAEERTRSKGEPYHACPRGKHGRCGLCKTLCRTWTPPCLRAVSSLQQKLAAIHYYPMGDGGTSRALTEAIRHVRMTQHTVQVAATARFRMMAVETAADSAAVASTVGPRYVQIMVNTV